MVTEILVTMVTDMVATMVVTVLVAIAIEIKYDISKTSSGAVSITRVGKTLVGRIENKKIEFVYDGLNYFKLSVPLDFVSVRIKAGYYVCLFYRIGEHCCV